RTAGQNMDIVLEAGVLRLPRIRFPLRARVDQSDRAGSQNVTLHVNLRGEHARRTVEPRGVVIPPLVEQFVITRDRPTSQKRVHRNSPSAARPDHEERTQESGQSSLTLHLVPTSPFINLTAREWGSSHQPPTK